MRRALRDTGWVAGSQAFSRALAFAAVVVVARLLAVDEFGTFVVLIALSTILTPILDAGMWPVVTRAASREPAAPRFSFTAAADAARFRIWLPVTALLAGAWALDLLPHADRYLLVTLAAIGQAEIDTLAGELTGRQRFAQVAAVRVAPGVIGLAGAATLPLIGANADSAIAIFAASRLLPALALQPFVPRAQAVNAISLRAALPFALTAGIMLIYINSDVLLLSLLGISAASVAVYGAAYRVLVGMQLIPGAVGLAAYPRAAAASPSTLPTLVQAAVGASVAACAATVAILFLDLPAFFEVFGDVYARGVSEVRVLLLVIIPIAASQIYISALQARDRERAGLKLVGVTALLNIGGNLALIPPLGVEGALIATTAAEWFLALGSCLLAARCGVTVARDVLPLAAAAGISLLGFSDAPGWWISAGIGVWLAIVWAMDWFRLRTVVGMLIRGRR